MCISEFDIATVTQEVWRAFIGIEVMGPVPTDDVRLPGHTAGTVYGACIDIAGPWQGRVVLDCTPALAGAAAAQVFDVAPEGVDREMVGAVLAELANQIGGNLKSLLPPGCAISLPRTLGSEEAKAALTDTHQVVHFEHAGQWFDVAVFGDVITADA